ncbi:MAG: hypothetical protein ACOX63_10405 [Christensenellales bacterium]|jgi:hypothetical protein
MKCPCCGHWNRASFPRCFKCGEPLHARQENPLPAEKLEEKLEKQVEAELNVVIHFDEDGTETIAIDPRDRLAYEMQSLHARKRSGEKRQEQLRTRSAERGFAPTGTGVNAISRRNPIFSDPASVQYNAHGAAQGEARAVDYDGYTTAPNYQSLDDNLSNLHYDNRARMTPAMPLPPRRMRKARLFGFRRALPFLAVFLFTLAAGLAAYRYIVKPLWLDEKEIPPEEQVQVTASILDDMPAHTVRIPAPDGTQIYIKELRRSFLSTGGYAAFQVPDYIWYELEDVVSEPTMDVALTPYVRTGSGEQKQMDIIRYTIDIPLSPLTLINPDVSYIEVSTPIYNIRFHVMQNSTVYINGEDYSSYVNTQNGLISYNAAIQPIGENVIHIVVRSQYYRQNEATLTIYRAVQDIPLDLSSTLDDESDNPTMEITATTMPGAEVTILSPYQEADMSLLNSTGAFKFKAVFNKIGVNTVTIQADYPGKESTVVNYDVYYLPSPDQYTPKAWALNEAWGYPDLLANLSTRIANTQIYVFTGPVTEIVSNKPQLVMFDANDGQGKVLPVMVENQTKTTWELGKRYRIYGDAYGMYNGIPRLIARYTYPPKK